jgi:hypothetical protein
MKISIKKFLLFTFILLEFASVAVFADTPVNAISTSPGVESGKRLKITVTLIIGKKPECDRFGFCDISIGINRTVPNSFTASMYVDDFNKNVMVLEVDRTKGMTAETNSKYFSSGYYQMDIDATIPTSVLNALGLSGTKTLVAGKHTIIERSGLLYISIPIK